jgi:3-oxoacyl-[acyl-carrier protein] reductase
MTAADDQAPRSALITGASRGIGRGVAEHLAARGWRLTLTSRDPADLRPLGEELLALGATGVVTHATDLADRASLPELVTQHISAYDDLDALVLNAGVGTAGTVERTSLDRLSKTLEVNFVGAFTLIQAALPSLRAAASRRPDTGAKIVAVSSITGVIPESGLAGYGASKAALLSLIETVNLEEAANGVTAGALAPGYVATEMSAWVTDTVPAHNMIQINDVVSAVHFLLHLSRHATVPRLVMTRATSDGRGA